MIKQREDETRLDYLLRVLEVYMELHGNNIIEYDEVECDGICLYDDIRNEIEFNIED